LVKSNFAESRQEERAEETTAFSGLWKSSSRASFIAREDWTRKALRERYSFRSTSISQLVLERGEVGNKKKNNSIKKIYN
jgi:hypothetical protein